MEIGSVILALARRRKDEVEPPPLIVELLSRAREGDGWNAGSYPFVYRVAIRDSVPVYEMGTCLGADMMRLLRRVVNDVSVALDPREIEPLTFGRLVDVLTRRSAERLAHHGVLSWV